MSVTFKRNIRKVEFQGLEIGGEKTFQYMYGVAPKYVLELHISHPEDSSHIVEDVYGEFYSDKIQMVKLAQDTPCDILGLNFNIKDESEIQSAVELLVNILPVIEKPLMIRGSNVSSVDEVLIPQLLSVVDREVIVGIIEEKTYKKIVPSVILGNHVAVLKSPIDINLAKELNILTTDLGLNPDKILIDSDMGGLGYGLEYGYSMMERIKLAGAGGDKMLNMPIIAFAGEESLKTKETKSDTFSKSFGDFKRRSLMFEIATASAVIAAGANVVVLNHPDSIKTMKGLV